MAPNFKRPKTCRVAHPNWAELPMDALGLILQKLTLPDQVRFGCVCKSWKLAVEERAWRLMNPNSHPYLMLPDEHNNNRTAKFFNFSENKTYHIPLPVSNPCIEDYKLIGSCYGWLVTVHNSSWDMHLLNPATGTQIRLPPVTTTPYFLGHEHCRSLLFHKAILSSPPAADGSGDFSIILIPDAYLADESCCSMAVTRAGDDSWATVTNLQENIADVTSHKGHIYGVDVRGLLYVWDQHHIPSGPKYVKITGCKASMTNKMLVGSATGDQIFMLDFLSESKDKFDVIRIDLHNLELAVLEPEIVNDLGDDVFFASLQAIFSVSATRFPELRRNCIYFCGFIPFPQTVDDFDVGVFDLKDESIKPLPNFTLSVDSSPIWIIPTL